MNPTKKPFVVAVTGGIASGKTAVTDGFARLGAPVLDADVVARDLVVPGQPALAEIVAHFGPEMLTAEGTLDRGKMRQRVFSDSTARQQLESILHPHVYAELSRQASAANAPYVIAAIPLLAETHIHHDVSWINRVLLVDVPIKVQIARLRARDRIDRTAAERVLAAQASRQQRLAIADDVLVNDGSLAALEGWVRTLHARYSALSKKTDCSPEK